MKHLKLSKNMRLGSNSAMSTTSPLDNYSNANKNSLKLKNGGGVPDSFLVPMILRKTKLKQKQNHMNSPVASNSIADHNTADPRQNIFYQDLTLEPT